ncbi:putative DD41D transposase [Trichonephila clavipes]|nr:putative DD41D transposase [Trichonephila clavipes]
MAPKASKMAIAMSTTFGKQSRKKLNVRTVMQVLKLLWSPGDIFVPLKCLVRSVAMVVEIARLQLRSGMKCFLTGWRLDGGGRLFPEGSVCSSKPFLGIEVKADVTFQDGDRFNSCQVIYSQFGLAFHQNDHQARRKFVEWAQNEIAVVPDFHKRILFSDEAHFWLNGYVNKQNCRIWSEANPQVYVETPLHPEKLTVWCALWAGGIIGPYFFKNDEGHNVTVNGDRYRAMITNFFIPELNNLDVQELWFQQDGATCHTARATIDLLKDTFGDHLISRFGPVNWPPRFCDLTPLDYFLWGYVKSLV